MSSTIVIADASPLIALARIEHLHVLQNLFGQVKITEIIKHEIVSNRAFAEVALLQAALDAGWLQVCQPDLGEMAKTELIGLAEGLDPGEKSAIQWASSLKSAGEAIILIIDEAKGRKVARRLSLDILGSTGIIAIAKRKGLIAEAKPLLEQLQRSGYFLSGNIVEMALRIAGER